MHPSSTLAHVRRKHRLPDGTPCLMIACWMNQSNTVGIPNLRVPPPAFGYVQLPISQSSFLALLLPSRTKASVPVFLFSPSAQGAPTMASADFSNCLVPALRPGQLLPHSRRSPRVMHTDFRAYVRPIYARDFRAKTGLPVFGPSCPSRFASYRVSVRQTSALLTAPFRFHLAMDTLAVPASSSPCRACIGL